MNWAPGMMEEDRPESKEMHPPHGWVDPHSIESCENLLESYFMQACPSYPAAHPASLVHHLLDC